MPNERENETSIIPMSCGDLPIELNRQNAISYFETSNYDLNLLNTTHTWHMVIVHHKGRVSQREILNALYAIVGDNEFYPVAYKKSDLYDKFLIRNCREAIHRLFEKRLTLNLPLFSIPLTFKFNVADYKFGQIYPAKRVEIAIETQFGKKETFGDVPNVLNLDKFSSHPGKIKGITYFTFKDVVIDYDLL